MRYRFWHGPIIWAFRRFCLRPEFRHCDLVVRCAEQDGQRHA